ncbi:hypothetical protein [Burkholderia sp. WAC0059]|uniref:hypothetical protein n=1 Tax=Burkholderia sp. WAC0059 TaxID=2066022 RepID=UPI0011AF9DE2|nr:hypothetical protein [Burkholderia sp. WAC0059]
MKRLLTSSAILALALIARPAFCEGTPAQPLEVNNAWGVLDHYIRDTASPVLFVVLKRDGAHWDIDTISDRAVDLRKTDDREMFVATPDLQHWSSAYQLMVNNCDSFEMKEDDYKSICTSQFSEKKIGRAIFATVIGSGRGGVGVSYNTDEVAAAIHSIRPDQAQAKLTAYEQGQ